MARAGRGGSGGQLSWHLLVPRALVGESVGAPVPQRPQALEAWLLAIVRCRTVANANAASIDEMQLQVPKSP